VASGPYRFSRNPMYLAIVTILAGWAALWSSLALALYTVAVLIAIVMRVRVHEEPWAERTFGADWQQYRARTARWIGTDRDSS
jgi:protein-S-isoprenylcysteine O-methyltransferase Ste14